MSNRKNGFILYHDSSAMIEMLTDEQAGKLIKAIFSLEVNGEDKSEELDQLTRMAYVPIRNYLIRDAEKYAERCRKNQQIALEREAKKRAEHERAQAYTNSTDTDRDIDSETDSDTDRDSERDTDRDRGFPKGEGETHVANKVTSFEDLLKATAERHGTDAVRALVQ